MKRGITLTIAAISVAACQTASLDERFPRVDRINASGKAEACTSSKRCFDYFKLENGGILPLLTSYAIHRTNTSVSRAIITIHGTSRTASSYYRTMVRAIRGTPERKTTIIIAPHFTIADDIGNRAVNELFWDSNSGWKKGDRSSRTLAHRTSSFAVMDELVKHLANRVMFPNLKTIVLAGHSAGGQFVQRYAAGHEADIVPSPIDMRYVVANPSSYLYFNRLRPTGEPTDRFDIPKIDSGCAYNRYKFGFERLNAYMRRTDTDTMIRRYRKRRVIYMAGEKDNDPAAKNLDRKCAAALQGKHRLQRAILFKNYMDRYFSPHNHQLLRIPGVGHSNRKMFTSPEARSPIFD